MERCRLDIALFEAFEKKQKKTPKKTDAQSACSNKDCLLGHEHPLGGTNI